MIYMDYAATSIKRKDVAQEIINNMDKFDGNPDSLHKYGREAKRILEESREDIAKSLNADKNQIVFTSGASESNNTVLNNFKGQKIITSNIEHDSILNTVDKENTLFLKANKNGIFKLSDLKRLINDDIKMVSLMYVNNETGVIEPLEGKS